MLVIVTEKPLISQILKFKFWETLLRLSAEQFFFCKFLAVQELVS